VWKYIPKNSDKDILFWNVGAEPVLEDETIYDRIDSYRDWVKNEKTVAE
jgi:glutathione synthase/RimK-type ligase-like ATP-grasp enzyme